MKYFKSEEAQETLSLGYTYEANTPLQSREHTFKTGAVYNGQWKGNLRHGNGTMTWADGAVYEGEWDHGTA